MTCFLHVTDTHLSFAQPAPANCGSASQLEAVYAWAAKLDRPPQFILITGDFVHEGGAEDYARARALTARLQADVDAGLRSPDVLARSLNRLPLYEQLDTCKVDVTNRTPQQTAAYILNVGEA